MFRVPLLVALSLAIAFGGGIRFTLYALDAMAGFGVITLGAWQAFPNLHTADADPYAKAHRSRTGELLYGTAEGLEFTADTDDSHGRLNAHCSYRISGQTPPARLWTLFSTGPDGKPLTSVNGRPTAINSWIALRNPDSSFTISVSQDAQPGNWLAVPDNGSFRLVLTLLDTPAAGSSGLIDLSMPTIQKIGCAHA